MKINQLHLPVIAEGLNLLKAYPGYKFGKTWSRPVSVNLLITSRCNSKCVTCDSWKLTDHDRELSLDDFARLAKDMRAMGIPIVTIGGGEPTLRKDLVEIIRVFKSAGLNVQLTTNALTLRQPQRQAFYGSGLDRLTISVDSHLPKVYEKIRGVDGADNVIENLHALLAEKPAHLAVDTNTVLCRDNQDTFLDTLDVLHEMGVPKLNLSAVTTYGGNFLMTESKSGLAGIPIDRIDAIVEGLLDRKRRTGSINTSRAFIEGLRRYFRDPSKLVYPCFAGYLSMDIFQDGSVYGCGNIPSFGNVRDGSLREIWESAKAEKTRRDMAEGRCPNCYVSCKIELAIAANPSHTASFAIDRLKSIS